MLIKPEYTEQEVRQLQQLFDWAAEAGKRFAAPLVTHHDQKLMVAAKKAHEEAQKEAEPKKPVKKAGAK